MKRRNSIEIDNPSAKRKQMADDVNALQNPSEKIAVPIAPVLTLNNDCLREILKYLNIVDLMNMCTASNRLRDIILEIGVKERLFDFGNLAHCCHILDVFKIFGQQMTKIKIGERDVQYKHQSISKFDEILRLIAKYCSIDTLTSLDLQYYNATSINDCFVDASIPFFRCIESFVINESNPMGLDIDSIYFSAFPTYNASVINFVDRAIRTAVNINSIKMHRLKISGRFFNYDHINNLRTLALICCNVKEPQAFVAFILNKPYLKSFTFENSSLRGMDSVHSHSSNCVFELVTKNIPNLEVFRYEPNHKFIDYKEDYVPVDTFIHPDYKLLAKFNKLKELAVDAITVDALNILTEQNTVEKLTIASPQPNGIGPVNVGFLQNFSSLKYIRVAVLPFGHVKEFTKDILSKLPNLTECKLDFLTLFNDVVKQVVWTGKNLSILKISFHAGQFTRALYSSLLRLRLQHGNPEKPLIIYINNNSMKSVENFISRLLGLNYQPRTITLKGYTDNTSLQVFVEVMN